jgi:AraC-like DNA-binding protein
LTAPRRAAANSRIEVAAWSESLFQKLSHVLGQSPSRHEIIRVPAPMIRNSVADMVIVDSRTVATLGLTRIADLRAERPRLIIAACLALTSDDMRLALQLGAAGVNHVWARETDIDPHFVDRVLHTSRLETGLYEDAQRIRKALPPLRHLRLEAALLSIGSVQTTVGLAHCLGVSPTRLADVTSETSLQTPRFLMAWLRLLSALRSLSERTVTAETAASRAGYASGPSFQNACKRLIGCSPGQVRGSAGLELAFAVLRHRANAPDRAFVGPGRSGLALNERIT